MRKTSPAIPKKECIILILGLLVIAALGLRPSIRGNDGVGNYVYLASLLRDGDLDFSNEYRDYDRIKNYPFKFSLLPLDPHTGRPTNRYGIGAAFLWAPFVLLTHYVFNATPLADPLSRPYEWAVGIATAFWGSLGLGMLYVRLRRRWTPAAAGATLVGLVFATPLGFYLYAHGSMSHGVSFYVAAGALLAFEGAWSRPAPLKMALCAFWAAWLVMIRFQDATWVAALGGILVWRTFVVSRSPSIIRARARNRNRYYFPWLNPLLNLLVFGLVFLVTFLPQMVIWRILNDSWLSGPTPYMKAAAEPFSPWPRHLLGTLFGERGGVLAWHPLFLFALAGLAMLARKDLALRPLAVLGLVGFTLQLWLVASWFMWWGGASFGNRFFISSLPFLAPGIAWWFGRGGSRHRRVLAYGVLAFLIVWNGGLLIQYATEMTPRENPIPWLQVIRQNLVDIPVYILRHL